MMSFQKGLSLAMSAVVGLSVGTCSAQELIVKNGAKIAFLGDSITQFGGNNPGGYVNLVIKGLEANGLKVSPIKAGISGHKSDDMLARVDRDVIEKKPDLMTLSCGVNDVWHGARGVVLDQYKTNITAIVDKAQAAKIQVVILTSTLIKAPDSVESVKLDAYNDFLRSLAKERNLPLADLSADMKAIIKEKGAKAGLTTDGVHMAINGDMMMATGVLRALGLNPSQIEKANEAWLDIPDTCAVTAKFTLRQYGKLSEKAGNGQSVDIYVKEQLSKLGEVSAK
ncbi:MAG: GDSL-type esterase/lipase family protein [bacterium]